MTVTQSDRPAATIREARVGDGLGIAKVHVYSWQTTYRGIMPDHVLDNRSVEKLTARWEPQLQNPEPETITLVAEVAGQIVGFVTGGPARGSDGSELYAIYLLQEHQRQAIGQRLFQELTDRLKVHGFRSMLLWVAKENHPSRAFYERMGGQLAGEKTEEVGGKPLVEVAYRYELR